MAADANSANYRPWWFFHPTISLALAYCKPTITGAAGSCLSEYRKSSGYSKLTSRAPRLIQNHSRDSLVSIRFAGPFYPTENTRFFFRNFGSYIIHAHVKHVIRAAFYKTHKSNIRHIAVTRRKTLRRIGDSPRPRSKR